MENQDNSFWRSNTRSIPGRPSPKKDIPKIPAGSTTSFERYQKSVSDAWTLSEDELTKEYCILSDEPKTSTRRLFKPNRTETIGVHRHQTTSTLSPSSSSSSSSSNNSAISVKIITATNNNNSCSAENPRDENENQQQRKVTETHSEKTVEYG